MRRARPPEDISPHDFFTRWVPEAVGSDPDRQARLAGTRATIEFRIEIAAGIEGEVFAIERHESLADSARARIRRLGYGNVEIIHGDGTLGVPEHAPYDAIVVSAGAPSVPESVQRQLAIGGRLVIPIGTDLGNQTLVRVRRTGQNQFERESLGGVRFVPLIGSEGWNVDGGSAAGDPSD